MDDSETEHEGWEEYQENQQPGQQSVFSDTGHSLTVEPGAATLSRANRSAQDHVASVPGRASKSQHPDETYCRDRNAECSGPLSISIAPYYPSNERHPPNVRDSSGPHRSPHCLREDLSHPHTPHVPLVGGREEHYIGACWKERGQILKRENAIRTRNNGEEDGRPSRRTATSGGRAHAQVSEPYEWRMRQCPPIPEPAEHPVDANFGKARDEWLREEHQDHLHSRHRPTPGSPTTTEKPALEADWRASTQGRQGAFRNPTPEDQHSGTCCCLQ